MSARAGHRMIWSEAARALFALDRPTAVSAGAGSGKTTALVELCVRLLSGEAAGAPCEPSEIVAITFTEKAAEELSERLREAVAARAAAAHAAAPGSADAQAWLARLRGMEAMAIGTIHGFAGRLLREHPVEAGVDPEFVVADEESASAWRREAARGAVVAALDAGRPVARALCAGFGAGGHGRFGLADVVAELVRERATLGQTAPPEPAADRTDEASEARRALLSTAEALLGAREEVKTASGRAALSRLAETWASLSPDDREGALGAGGLHRLGALAAALKGWRAGKTDGDRARALREELALAAAQFPLLAAEALAGPQKRELCRLVAEAETRYGGRKAAEGALDFDDLLLRARALLAADAPLRHELRARTRALLVDEYQDVNALQQGLFDLLAGPEAGAPAPATLVGVGDLKQSIYRFRGADVSVFAGLVSRLAPPASGGRVLHLSDNHRSAPAVLDLVNAVFARALQPVEEPARPYEIRFSEADRLLALRPEGMRPACEILVDREEGRAAERRAREAHAVAERVRAIVEGRAGVSVRERGDAGEERARRPRFGDVAILFRRLTQIGEYERALRAAGIPYRLARGGGFYQAPEVRDLGELVAALFDPEDATAWAALLRSPFCGVLDGTLFALSRLGLATLWRRSPEELRAAVDAAGEGGSQELHRLVRFLQEWRALRAARDRLSLPDLLERVVDRLDLEAALLAGPDGERRVVNVRKAISVARRFAEAGGTSHAFAEHLRTLAQRPPREPEAELEVEDAVAVLSIHQAKGLEWPVVFIPDLGARARADARRALLDGAGRVCAQLFDPARESFESTVSVDEARAEGQRAGVAESRRLLYVALTRARDYLVLSGEAGRGGEDSWRALVEAGASEGALAAVLPMTEAGTRAVAAPLPPEPAPPRPIAPVAPPRLAPPAPLAALRVAVTDLAEYARCPRRHYLSRHLGLPERTAASGAPAQDDPARATARGTLAHAMLAELDLAAPPLERRAQLTASATRRGYDPASPAVRRILADVSRFADSAAGRHLSELARAGGLRREVPFLLRIDGKGAAPACYLVGAIDALAEERGRVSVIDFKYAVARPGAEERYRIQLLAYALAARRARPGRPVRARLQFLRGSCASIDVSPGERDLAAFAAEAPKLALGAFQGARDATPAALGRDETRCRAEGCGYVTRCYPDRETPTDAG